MDLTQMANGSIPQKMLDSHKFQTLSGVYSEHRDCLTNLSSTYDEQKTRKEDDLDPDADKQPTKINMQDITANQKIHISAETFNCHGFAQSSEYVMNRLNSCDILCLTETWIWPHEVNLISDTIRNHPTIKISSQEYTVISKCGMHDRAQDYSGYGYGGVAVIV